MTDLSRIEVDAIHEALDDDVKAWVTCDQVIDDFGPIWPFVNISDAKARHIQNT